MLACQFLDDGATGSACGPEYDVKRLMRCHWDHPEGEGTLTARFSGLGRGLIA
jgi:hypothetical protein